MNETELQVSIDLEEHPAVTAPEMQLLADLLPDLIKNMLSQQPDTED